MKLIVRYSYSDQYQHPLFISSNDIHTHSYNTLVRLANKLKSDFPNSYLNVYLNEYDIVYLKTTTYRKELWTNGIYEIECNPIIKTNSKNQKYVVLKLINLNRIEEDKDIIYDF
jgi:hypothetical protein